MRLTILFYYVCVCYNTNQELTKVKAEHLKYQQQEIEVQRNLIIFS